MLANEPCSLLGPAHVGAHHVGERQVELSQTHPGEVCLVDPHLGENLLVVILPLQVVLTVTDQDQVAAGSRTPLERHTLLFCLISLNLVWNCIEM